MEAKRGESIVEVVVACGILSLLFASVATIVVGSVGLNSDSRLRMAAVSLAQTKLNEYIVDGGDGSAGKNTGTCLVGSDLKVTVPAGPVSGDIGCPAVADSDLKDYLDNTLNKDTCNYVQIRQLTSAEKTSGGSFSNSSFLVVESFVRWANRDSAADEYVIRKMISL